MVVNNNAMILTVKQDSMNSMLICEHDHPQLTWDTLLR